MTTMTEPTPAPSPSTAPRSPTTSGERTRHRAAAAPHRLADGRRRVRHAGEPLRRPHRRRPTTRAASSAARSAIRSASRRRSSTPTTSTGSSRRWAAGRSTCSRAAAARSTRSPSSRRTPTTSGRSSRTSRRSLASCPTASTLAVSRAVARDLPAARLRAGMAHFIAVVSPPGPVRPADLAPARAGSGDVRLTGRRRRQAAPTHCSARTSSPARTTSPTSTPCAPRRPGSSWRPARSRTGELANRGAHAVAERLGTEPVAFPSDHGGFLGGEYGPATRMPSPRRCARSSRPPDAPRHLQACAACGSFAPVDRHTRDGRRPEGR